jgi:hypothetical protein
VTDKGKANSGEANMPPPSGDPVSRSVGAVITEHFWALLVAVGGAMFGWLAAIDDDQDVVVRDLEREVAELAQRVATLEGQMKREK